MNLQLTEPELCFNLVAELKSVLKNATMNYLRAGDILELAFDSKIYKHFDSYTKKVGVSEGKTWSYFISQTCPFGVAMADHIRRVSREFKNYIGDRNVPFDRLLEMLPVVNDENRIELLDKACDPTTTHKSFHDDIRKLKGKRTTDDCEHTNTQQWKKCRDCGAWLKG